MAPRPYDSSKLETLGKILRQEARGGFADKTVTSGLDEFLERAADELVPVIGSIPSYSGLTSDQRKAWADATLSRIAAAPPVDTLPGGAPPVSTPPLTKPPVRRRASKPPAPKVTLRDDVTRLRSVTKQNLPKLKRLGVKKVEDLVYLFPHRHNDFANTRKVSELTPGEEQTVVVKVWEASQTGRNPRRKSTQAILGDDTGNIRAIWFNQPWLATTLKPGAPVAISGKVGVFRGQPVFENPEYELLQGEEELVHTGRLVPVYPLTEGLYQRTLRRIAKQALDATLAQVADFLPEDMRHRIGVIGAQNAIAQMHYPDSPQDWATARRRLAFDELFLMQLAVIARKRRWRQQGDGIQLSAHPAKIAAYTDSLPFALTGAQSRSLDEILRDLRGDKPMSRLLQGDVGSGKTVVAVVALLAAALDGYQGALMAPTEILAEQHFLSISRLLSGGAAPSLDEHLASVEVEPMTRPLTIALLLGSLPRRAKEEVHERIAQGEVDIVVGTQALIQDTVEAPRLAVVVVDEQHRFGVMQRASLREKGSRPHMLAMSATPIPRSLALTLYGDLDISIIDELPPGRQTIRTRWVEPERRMASYGFVRKQVEQGRQAFIVCPLIEESEAIQSRAAVEEYERLSTNVFPDLRLGLLHGRMPLREKEQVLDLFQQGKLEVLVSTPVVEVGIDVPNASVMLIDGADRFGLAQLHQFRGRVGRGVHQSYCLLLADAPGQDARERLKLVERIQDGFQLAEEDLALRGAGDYMGTRQSGLPDLRVARISDQELLVLARREAERLLESDPTLSKDENALLAQRYKTFTASNPFDPS